MQREPGIKWLFLDLNSYFASVEQQENPALRGKPVAVVPMITDATCAIAASYEAKIYGIKTGTKVYEAKALCPNLTCVLARHDVYVDYHNRILKEVDRHTLIDRVWSIDEVSSLISPDQRSIDKAVRLAQNIKEGIWKNVGTQINCSIGFAPNSLLAKIAMDMQKPDGLVIIRQEDLPGPLLNLKLSDIPGIGFNMERRLINAGVTNMKALWETSPKQARKIWGSVQGERIWYWLHGYDFPTPDNGNNVMIGHSRVLDPDLRSPDKARQMARRLLTKATYRLRRKNYFASSVSLSVRTIDDRKWSREIRLSSPARDPFTFLKYMDFLWDEMIKDFGYDRRLKFKKISTLLLGLKNEHEITYDLLDEGYQNKKNILKKREALAGALDKLQEKYQREMVCLGVTPKTSAGHVGTKIAFSRVPDQEEFWN